MRWSSEAVSVDTPGVHARPESLPGKHACSDRAPRGSLSCAHWLARALCFLVLLLLIPVQPVHATTHVGSASAANNGSTVTADRPAGVEEGDIIVAQVAFRGGSGDSITAPPEAGFTEVRRMNGSDITQAVFYRIAGASEPAGYTWSVGGDRIVVIHSAYSGVDPADPIDVVGGQSGSGSTVTAPSVTTSTTYTRLIGSFAAAEGGGSFDSAPASMAQRANLNTGGGPNGTRALLADEVLEDNGASGDREANAATSAANVGQLVALRRAPAGEPAALRFSTQPSDTQMGYVISPAVEVQVVDADGNLVTDSTAEITVAIGDNPAGGTLSGATTVQAVDGIAAFDDLSIDEISDGYTLSASATDLDGDTSEPFDIIPPQQEANAFDPDTPEGEVVGDIRTRVAGAPFDLDIVALDEGEVDTGFSDSVEIYLLDASDNSGDLDDVNCRDTWTRIRSVGTIDFDGSENGRTTLTGIEEPESWSEVRVEIYRDHPSPQQSGVIGCSNDAFAIRPDAFVDVMATDSDRETAGDARVLDNADPGGAPVHNASAPFTIEARAVNADGDTTQNYAGSPVGIVSCIEADQPCDDGTFAEGTWNTTDGVITTDSATYSEVGAFDLTLEDREFAAVDEDDSTEDERFVRSGAPVGVGRFVPEHFFLLAVALVDRIALDDLGCSSDFTYIGEDFEASFVLVAENADDATTRNYQGDWARLTTVEALDFGAVNDGNELTADLVLPGWQGTWSAGELDAAYAIHLVRQDPVGPYPVFEIGIRPEDADGVSLLSSQLDLDVDGDGSADRARTGATELRFGRLVVDNAGGAEIAPIDAPMRTEYWTGDNWNVNGLDSCTTLALASEIELTNGTDTVSGDQPIAVGGGQTSITSGDPVLTGGTTTITFSAPGADNTGWVDLTALLEAGTPGYAFLQGDPEDDGSWSTNPTGRVTFGIYDGNERWIDVRRVPVN